MLTERRFDAIRFRGPGTDLTVGLLPGRAGSRAAETTVYGVRCVVNMPTEEVFTTPDRRRAEGVVRCTRPLLCEGVLVEGLEMSSRAAASCASTPTPTPTTSAARWRATRAPRSWARWRW